MPGWTRVSCIPPQQASLDMAVENESASTKSHPIHPSTARHSSPHALAQPNTLGPPKPLHLPITAQQQRPHCSSMQHSAVAHSTNCIIGKPPVDRRASTPLGLSKGPRPKSDGLAAFHPYTRQYCCAGDLHTSSMIPQLPLAVGLVVSKGPAPLVLLTAHGTRGCGIHERPIQAGRPVRSHIGTLMGPVDRFQCSCKPRLLPVWLQTCSGKNFRYKLSARTLKQVDFEILH